MKWRLPESLNVGGSDYRIRTDFRDILTIFDAYNDPDLPDEAKTYIMMKIIYPDLATIPEEHLQEAAEKAVEFMNCGQEDGDKTKPALMDWNQDADILVPAINKVAGYEIRSVKYLHWWTFIGFYMEIGESLFSQVVNIRYKHAHGKTLEKWEKEFEKDNRQICKLKKKLSDEEQERRDAEMAALKELI